MGQHPAVAERIEHGPLGHVEQQSLALGGGDREPAPVGGQSDLVRHALQLGDAGRAPGHVVGDDRLPLRRRHRLLQLVDPSQQGPELELAEQLLHP